MSACGSLQMSWQDTAMHADYEDLELMYIVSPLISHVGLGFPQLNITLGIAEAIWFLSHLHSRR